MYKIIFLFFGIVLLGSCERTVSTMGNPQFDNTRYEVDRTDPEIITQSLFENKESTISEEAIFLKMKFN